MGEVELDAVPSWFSDVVDTVLPDLQRPGAVRLGLGFEPTEERAGILWVWEVGGSGRAGFRISDGEASGVDLLVGFADWLQEQVFPETTGAWGEARPECPGHPHAAAAVELDGEAWWVCPMDGRRIGMIGRLGR